MLIILPDTLRCVEFSFHIFICYREERSGSYLHLSECSGTFPHSCSRGCAGEGQARGSHALAPQLGERQRPRIRRPASWPRLCPPRAALLLELGAPPVPALLPLSDPEGDAVPAQAPGQPAPAAAPTLLPPWRPAMAPWSRARPHVLRPASPARASETGCARAWKVLESPHPRPAVGEDLSGDARCTRHGFALRVQVQEPILRGPPGGVGPRTRGPALQPVLSLLQARGLCRSRPSGDPRLPSARLRCGSANVAGQGSSLGKPDTRETTWVPGIGPPSPHSHPICGRKMSSGVRAAIAAVRTSLHTKVSK